MKSLAFKLKTLAVHSIQIEKIKKIVIGIRNYRNIEER